MINYEILKQINKSAVIKMTGARIGFKFWLRFVVAGRYTDSEDVKFSWDMIRRTTNKVLSSFFVRKATEMGRLCVEKAGAERTAELIPLFKV